MRERRLLRFAVEALFLGALAAALAIGDLSPLAIAGVMLLGWLVVALYEWATTRELPHYGRGLPPRYYVPQVSLPPPRQLEQLRSGYPAADRDGEATWIATPAMRAEALADWPVGPVLEPAPGEDTMVVGVPPLEGALGEPFHEDTWIELDPVAAGMPEAAAALVEEDVVAPEPVAVAAEPELAAAALLVDEPEVAEEPEAARRRRLLNSRSARAEAAVVPTAAAERAEEPAAAVTVEPEASEPEVVEAVEVVAAAVVVAEPEAEPEQEPVSDPEPEPEPDLEAEPEEDDTEEDAVPAAPVVPESEPLARHTFDPLGSQAHPRRRWRRRDDAYVELPDRPPVPAALPGVPRRER